jgi:hypothetical protein
MHKNPNIGLNADIFKADTRIGEKVASSVMILPYSSKNCEMIIFKPKAIA